MKKCVFIFIMLILTWSIFAQSVGINADGSQPDGSAILDIKSSSKGLLVPRIALTGISDASTISSPATGLLIFNTATASGITPGYYYNSGTSGSPSWTRLVTSVAAADGSETKVNSGTLISVTGSGTTASPYIVNYSGTLPVTSGGTGATTAAAARTNLGAGTSDLALGTTSSTAYRGDYGNTAYTHSQATTGTVHGSTTVGGNLMRLTNPSAVKFLRFNADNTVSTLTAAEFRTAIGAGDGSGTVTSIATGNGITGGTITSTGTLGLTGQALAVHNLATNGLIARTAAGTVAGRTLTAGTGTTVSNGDGVSGNPTIGLTGQALAVHNLATNGLITRTAAGTVAGRTLTSSGNGISVTNGDGVSGNPTVSLSIGTGSTQVAAGNHTHSEYDAIPPGSIMQFAGSTAPTGWVLCDGTSYSTSTYATLYAAIGTAYGSGTGTFKVPDLRSRIPVGRLSTDTSFDVLGETGGEKTHAIATAEMPSHTHSVDPPSSTTTSDGAHTHTARDYYPNSSILSDDANQRSVGAPTNTYSDRTTTSDGAHTHTLDIASFTSGSAGSGTAMNVLQPYIVLNYIIKY